MTHHTSKPSIFQHDQLSFIKKQVAFFEALDKLVVESSLIVRAWKEIEREWEQQPKDDPRRDDAWWERRLSALRDRDWTMFRELRRLKVEWYDLTGRARN